MVCCVRSRLNRGSGRLQHWLSPREAQQMVQVTARDRDVMTLRCCDPGRGVVWQPCAAVTQAGMFHVAPTYSERFS